MAATPAVVAQLPFLPETGAHTITHQHAYITHLADAAKAICIFEGITDWLQSLDQCVGLWLGALLKGI